MERWYQAYQVARFLGEDIMHDEPEETGESHGHRAAIDRCLLPKTELHRSSRLIINERDESRRAEFGKMGGDRIAHLNQNVSLAGFPRRYGVGGWLKLWSHGSCLIRDFAPA